MHQVTSKQPVDRRAQYVADRRDRDQDEPVVRAREVEAGQHELRLRGQHGRRQERSQEQAREGRQIVQRPPSKAGASIYGRTVV